MLMEAQLRISTKYASKKISIFQIGYLWFTKGRPLYRKSGLTLFFAEHSKLDDLQLTKSTSTSTSTLGETVKSKRRYQIKRWFRFQRSTLEIRYKILDKFLEQLYQIMGSILKNKICVLILAIRAECGMLLRRHS